MSAATAGATGTGFIQIDPASTQDQSRVKAGSNQGYDTDSWPPASQQCYTCWQQSASASTWHAPHLAWMQMLATDTCPWGTPSCIKACPIHHQGISWQLALHSPLQWCGCLLVGGRTCWRPHQCHGTSHRSEPADEQCNVGSLPWCARHELAGAQAKVVTSAELYITQPMYMTTAWGYPRPLHHDLTTRHLHQKLNICSGWMTC
jgi:hypothetical protein